MSLSKDAILTAEDLETRVVDVPEWGGKVNIKALSGIQRNAFEQSMIRMNGDDATPNLGNYQAKLVARCLVDDNGEPLFASAEEITELGAKSAQVLGRLFEIASEMSGLSEKDVEKLAGNSDAAQSGASTSS